MSETDSDFEVVERQLSTPPPIEERGDDRVMSPEGDWFNAKEDLDDSWNEEEENAKMTTTDGSTMYSDQNDDFPDYDSCIGSNEQLVYEDEEDSLREIDQFLSGMLFNHQEKEEDEEEEEEEEEEEDDEEDDEEEEEEDEDEEDYEDEDVDDDDEDEDDDEEQEEEEEEKEEEHQMPLSNAPRRCFNLGSLTGEMIRAQQIEMRRQRQGYPGPMSTSKGVFGPRVLSVSHRYPYHDDRTVDRMVDQGSQQSLEMEKMKKEEEDEQSMLLDAVGAEKLLLLKKLADALINIDPNGHPPHMRLDELSILSRAADNLQSVNLINKYRQRLAQTRNELENVRETLAKVTSEKEELENDKKALKAAIHVLVKE